jgi:hypothetical protein
MTICRRCDFYVGYGAGGLFKQPQVGEPHFDTGEVVTFDWLKDHCWCCGRSEQEIRTAQGEGDAKTF